MADPKTIPGELLSRLARFGHVYLLDTVPSTNDYALGLAARREPAVVIAREQTRGRGRFRRHWHSSDDSITFSTLLFPPGDVLAPAGLTLIAGVALSRAVQSATGIKTAIRWPNDVMFGERKLAGVLCEAKSGAVVIGVGLNVNQTTMPESLPDAVSLRMVTGREYDRFTLLESFLGELDACVRRAAQSGLAALLPEIKERSATIHRRVEVKTMFRRHVGTAIDLDADGRIVLRTDSGRLEVIGAGQVRQLR